ncbi:hypothetical protein LXA43DRAFT_1103396 [Ganoderma leucocontextum]|nr:hypothetical protein LXA43DRAFT_1103396 [Ganoderma leucocontextum]
MCTPFNLAALDKNGQSDAAFHTQILIAQRHYSALAKTIAVLPSLIAATAFDRCASMDDTVVVSGVECTPTTSQPLQHLRVRSVSSITGNSVDSRFPVSPPTPPSVRELKSSSSAGLSFGPPIARDNMVEIDALLAKVLPLLVPGLSIGNDIRVHEEWGSWMSTSPRDAPAPRLTPAEQKAKAKANLKTLATKERKVWHCRHHFSLPRRNDDINCALENKRNTVYAYTGELVPNTHSHLNALAEDEELLCHASPMSPAAFSNPDRPVSAQTFGHDTLRASELHMALLPPSATSEVMLFDPEHFTPKEDGPLASSTPHESQRTKHKSKMCDIPAVPQLHNGPKTSRWSGIWYIIPDENAPVMADVNANPAKVNSE